MKKKPSPKAVFNRLKKAAKAAMRHAHAPYSRFRVGAALLTRRGDIVSGCNVENGSYGLTNCAERTAIFSAVARYGPKMGIDAILVLNSQDAPCSPCGACRQVIYEFGPNAVVHFRGANGWKSARIADLLPEGFRLK